MGFRLVHTCLKVEDLSRTLQFHQQALAMVEKRRVQAGPMTLVYLGDSENTPQEIELQWQPEVEAPGNLGDNPTHLAFVVADFAAARERHRQLGYVVEENPVAGIYWLEDPDGYRIEILPEGHFSQGGTHED